MVTLELTMLMITSLRQMFVAAGTLLCFSDRLSVWQQVQDRGEPRSCRQLGVDGGSWWACCEDIDHHWDLRQRRCKYLTVSLSNLSLEVCGKRKLCSDSVKSELSQNLASFSQFSNKNCVQFAVQIKTDNNNITCIECVDKERFTHDWNRVWYAQFIPHDSNAVMFAVSPRLRFNHFVWHCARYKSLVCMYVCMYVSQLISQH